MKHGFWRKKNWTRCTVCRNRRKSDWPILFGEAQSIEGKSIPILTW